mmetsp:Transcript_7469/g.16528  ORF Transcript_7469/g.16528 Transcript_7469/m.16528 type:complete len:415 (-) Transcript_7469:30-1274(-)|eukprot:CAMPEP_0168770646 /NCGR_PEP_ID=MMETSP0725-20121227/3028_1 /TAXON_ID=265536 /ORGANISM="Amphiprora sp., Strain CCMP467" /LENGTH=414 /DNA_ID=CAMNT_0008820099 /DNA_START=118 /DNA_END=1362 /DNA_ORIENTATION=-
MSLRHQSIITVVTAASAAYVMCPSLVESFASSKFGTPLPRHGAQATVICHQSTTSAAEAKSIAAVSSAFVSRPVDAAKYDDLVKWIESQDGALVHDAISIQPSASGSGYGVFVTQDIEEGELLLKIPRSACVTLENALNDEASGKAFAKLIEQAGSAGGNTVCLAGFLARERLRALEHRNPATDNVVEDSFFGPYIETLPWERGINNQESVLFWTDDSVDELLTGTMCWEEVTSLREEVDVAITVINAICGRTVREWRGQVPLKPSFQWPWEAAAAATNEPDPKLLVPGLPLAVKGAFVSLLTRAFEDNISGNPDDDEDREKLVPLMDLMQHSEEPNIRHSMSSAEQGAVVVTARRALTKGDELLNQYRSELEESMPYHRFFSRFGFVPGIEQEDIEPLLKERSSIFVAQKREV